MGLMQSMRISASALLAQRLRMDVVANNVANMNTTRTAGGGPYRRQSVVFAEQGRAVPFRDFLQRESGAPSASGTGGGVHVTEIRQDNTPPRSVFDPQHPDADPEGNVLLPDINIVTELTDLVSARRAYEASVTVLNATKAMALRALEIGRA
jgi:flagellar basal-body rod protein FlgC